MTQILEKSPPSTTASTTTWPPQSTHITRDQRSEPSSNGCHSVPAHLMLTNQTTTESLPSSESNTATTTVPTEELKLIEDDEIIKNYGKQIINSILYESRKYNYLSICKI